MGDPFELQPLGIPTWIKDKAPFCHRVKEQPLVTHMVPTSLRFPCCFPSSSCSESQLYITFPGKFLHDVTSLPITPQSPLSLRVLGARLPSNSRPCYCCHSLEYTEEKFASCVVLGTSLLISVNYWELRFIFFLIALLMSVLDLVSCHSNFSPISFHLCFSRSLRTLRFPLCSPATLACQAGVKVPVLRPPAADGVHWSNFQKSNLGIFF